MDEPYCAHSTLNDGKLVSEAFSVKWSANLRNPCTYIAPLGGTAEKDSVQRNMLEGKLLLYQVAHKTLMRTFQLR